MKNVSIALISAVLLSGCATMFSGSTDPVTFKSVPPGAKVEINGNQVGRTPVTVPLKRSLTPPMVQLKLDGYEPKTLAIQNSFNGVSILNVFFWPGFIVDTATGTIMKYDVLTYEADLDSIAQKSASN